MNITSSSSTQKREAETQTIPLAETNMQEGKICAIRTIWAQLSNMQIMNDHLYGSSLENIYSWDLIKLTQDNTYKLGDENSSFYVYDGGISKFIVTETNIFCGLENGKIKKSTFDNSIVERKVHNNSVSALLYDGDFLFSGSKDFIAQSDANLNLIRHFNFHKDFVTCLHLHQNNLYSGSKDKIVVKWELNTKAPINEYKGHESAIASVMVVAKYLFTVGLSDAKINMWNKNSNQLMHTFNLMGKNPKIHIEGSYLTASVSDSSGINAVALRRWNYTTKEVVCEIKAYNWFKLEMNPKTYPQSNEAVVAKSRFVNSFVIAGNKVYMSHSSAPYLSIADLETKEIEHTLLNGSIVPFNADIRNCAHHFLGCDDRGSVSSIVKNDRFICLSDADKITVMDFQDNNESQSYKKLKDSAAEITTLTLNGTFKTLRLLTLPLSLLPSRPGPADRPSGGRK